MNSKDIYKDIGKRIKENREKKNLTQPELSKLIGTSVTYISSIERGLSFPRGDKLVSILNALSISADAIFCDVVDASAMQQACVLYNMLSELPQKEQKKIMETIEFLIYQAKKNK